uniref:Uncharacterized protein n=1 Tax=Ascaris lumbricoides TaxID=6252 RepID=A0A0M3HFC8_ASCLU
MSYKNKVDLFLITLICLLLTTSSHLMFAFQVS